MRVALITGGTRGIGAAISIKLKEAGYKVAAKYAGNDQVATKFSKENSKLKILGGIMGSDILDVAGVQNVATLPTLDEARAKIVGILRSPAQKIASILLAPASKIAILALEKSKK